MTIQETNGRLKPPAITQVIEKMAGARPRKEVKLPAPVYRGQVQGGVSSGLARDWTHDVIPDPSRDCS